MHAPLQIVFVKQMLAGKDFAKISQLTVDCAITVCGTYSRVKEGYVSPTGYELVADDWRVDGVVTDPSTHYHEYPEHVLPPSYFEMSRSYEHAPYSSQFITIATIYKIHEELAHALESYFRKDFQFVKMPVITFGDCEGGSEQFLIAPPRSARVKELLTDPLFDQFKYFFGAVASMSGSAQLELEAVAQSVSAFCKTIAFRAEESDTAKHLSEFVMYELEKLFTRSSKDVRDIAEGALKHMLAHTLDHLHKYVEFVHAKLLDVDDSFQQQFTQAQHSATDFQEVYARTKSSAVATHMAELRRFLEEPFAVIKHADAVGLMLQQPTGTFVELPGYDKDLSSEHERFITQHFGKPTHVIYFPQAIKSFYMPLIAETFEESRGVPHVDCFDTLWPGTGEVVGGSQRITTRQELTDVAISRSMDLRPLEPYFATRDHGMPPHGGFGIGFDRIGKCILGGLASFSVRDFTPFTRYRRCGKAYDC